MSRINTPITITISGCLGSGKTVIALLLEKFLIKRGASVIIKEEHLPIPPAANANLLDDARRQLRRLDKVDKIKLHRSITIQTISTGEQ